MNLKLDHIIIAVHDLDKAVADYRDVGFTVIYGGEHASGTTHNALICFRDGTYFELLASTGKPPKAGVDAMEFGHLVKREEGLAGFACYADDIEATAQMLRKSKVTVSEIISGSRTRKDGVVLKWRTIWLDNGLYPFIIQDVTDRDLRVPTDEETVSHANGAIGINQLTIPAHHDRVCKVLGNVTGQVTSFKLKSFKADQIALELGALDYVSLTGLSATLPADKTHGIIIEG